MDRGHADLSSNDAAAVHPGAPPAAGNELFLHNMRALWRWDPVLAMRVDAVRDDQRIPVERTRSGAWTGRMVAPDGQAVYLHSRYDPSAEAKRFAASVNVEDKFCFVISGLGLGYPVLALSKRIKGDAVILCSEPSLELIATALTCVDLTELIGSRRFILLTDDDKARLHERLGPYNALIMLGAQFAHHPPSMRVAESSHKAINRVIAEFVTYTRMTLTTLVANSRITCKNIAMNLVHYVTTPPIDNLRNRYNGNPAIVISAGPSLSRNMDQLAQLKGRAVLIAVQTTMKPLMQSGIVPDFVTSLDFHPVSRTFFDGVDGLESVHLVAEPKATWHVLDDYPGPTSLLHNHWAQLVVGDELGARGGLQAGATVAHLAFYLAVYMGCDPVIFVGQDLAFTGHSFYVPGVEIHQSWRSELNRFSTIEQKEWDRIVRNRPILRRVTSVDGAQLYTDELLFTYLEQLEKDIAGVSCRVINASEGGARIRGTTSMTLKEATERFCSQGINAERFAYARTTQMSKKARLQSAKIQLEQRISELDEAVVVCDELLNLFEELKGLMHDPTRFNQRLIRVDELRTRVQQDSRTYRIINAATQLAEFRRFSADRRINAAETDDVERAKSQIARDSEFITAVREGAIDVKEILLEALERVVPAAESS